MKTVANPNIHAGDHAPQRSAELQPILSGFFPDPTICRVEDSYYLATSSFEYFPGAPIFHSTDLVTWTQIGNILDRRSQFRAKTLGPSTGIYGSTLRHHNGQFWFATTNVSDFNSGQMLVHTTDPHGPWSEPIFVPEAVGIDPDLCWDDDGTCYLTWHALDFEVGGQGIKQAPIDLTTGRLLEHPYEIWQGSGLPAAEGPHLFEANGSWYIVLAEGGTERGHSVTVARSTSPRGPFEPCPWNPIFTRRSTFHEVQNVGHADIVSLADGTWAAVYLGVRPLGPTPGFHALGRETFIAGIDWVDGWPVFDPGRFEIPIVPTVFTDEFEGPLNARWVVPDGQIDSFARSHPAGGLTLTAAHEQAGSTLCARVRDLRWSAEAQFSGGGALGVRLDDRHWCRVEYDGNSVWTTTRVGDLVVETDHVQISATQITLRLDAVDPIGRGVPFGHAGPDEVVLSVLEEKGPRELGRRDGRYFTTEVASGFTGRMLTLSGTSNASFLRRVTYIGKPTQ